MARNGRIAGGDSANPGGRDPIRVLYVDDDSEFAGLAATYLERLADEMTVVTATSTSRGFDRLETESIDCVVCDYELPSRTGVEFLRSVRETRPEIPFVLFTGRGDEGVASEAISAGVTDYLRKRGNEERFERLANRIRHAVDQYRTDRELADLRRRYERAARASSDAFVDWKIPSDCFWWAEGVGQPFGYAAEAVSYEFSWWRDRIHPDDRQRVDDTLRESLKDQETLLELTYRFRRADGTYAHTVSRGYVTYEDGAPVRVTGALIDISEQKERQQSLTRLHRASREFIEAETVQDICEVVVRSANESLDLSVIIQYVWDDDEGTLRPRASTLDAAELYDELPVLTLGSSPAWNVFVDGETAVFDDVDDREDSPIRSELIVPLGEYGVLIAGSETCESIARRDVQFAETLTANATAAFRRAERERTLREKERQLREQNETLTRLDRINSIIRTIQRDVVKATTHDEIVRAVCDDLNRVEEYQFSWIGTVDESGTVSPSAWAGDGGGTLDGLLGDAGDGSPSSQSPVRRALEAEEVVSVQQLRKHTSDRPSLRPVLELGYRSLIAVPLTFRDSSYGALVVYSDQPTSFGTEEREILEEVCDFAANALNAIDRRQALVLQSDTELEFRIGDVDDVLFRLARDTGCTLDLDSMLPQSGGKWVLYLRVSDCECDAFRAVADRQRSVERVTPLEGKENLFEVAVSDFEIAKVLGEQGAKLHSLHAGPDGGHVVIHLPQTTDVSSFREACTSVFSTVQLVRRTQVSGNATAGGVTRPSGEVLTDRQRDVMEAAYRNGFFEWPRESTGEEVANRLDVSPPTFHRHVRIGTRRLLEPFFE